MFLRQILECVGVLVAHTREEIEDLFDSRLVEHTEDVKGAELVAALCQLQQSLVQLDRVASPV